MARNTAAENARRGAYRRIEEFKKQSVDKYETASTRKAARKEITRLRNLIEGTYVRNKKGGKRKVETIQRNLANLQKANVETTKAAFRKNIRMSNAVMKTQIRLASNKETEVFAVEGITREKVAAFYGGTKHIWNKEGVADRNAAIMKYYKTKSLHAAWDAFFDEVDKVKDINEKLIEGMELTPEEQKLYDTFKNIEEESNQEMSSAEYVISLVDVAFQNA